MRSTAALLAAASGLAMPRAIVGSRVRAEAANPVDMIHEIRDHVVDLRTNMQAQLDECAVQISAMKINGPDAGALVASPDPDYTRTFAGYMRGSTEAEAKVKAMNASGGSRFQVQAAMSAGSQSDGGYVAPVEWDRRILQAQLVSSPMRRIATVQPTSVGAFTSLWSNNLWGSGWVGETASRPATSTPGLAPILFKAGEIYANPAVTQTLLDDAQFDIQTWLATNVAREFDRQEDIEFVAGDGVNKPAGFLTYVAGGTNATTHPGGTLDVVASGDAATIKPDALIAFTYGLLSPYRQNAKWVMGSGTAGIIRTLKDGAGRYLWSENYIAGEPPTLLGYPVVIDENMPAVAAGNMPIAFGDFASGYLINDRIGTRILRDPYSNKPYVSFYVTKRVGAGVQDPRAIRLMKIAAS